MNEQMNEHDQNSQRMRKKGPHLKFSKERYMIPTANTHGGVFSKEHFSRNIER